MNIILSFQKSEALTLRHVCTCSIYFPPFFQSADDLVTNVDKASLENKAPFHLWHYNAPQWLRKSEFAMLMMYSCFCTMLILGINEDHNATAALLKDGEVVFAASEERISRKKNDVGYPYEAIEEALRESGYIAKDIDAVTFSAIETGAIDMKIKRITRFKISDYVREMHEYWKPTLTKGKNADIFWDALMREERFNKPQEERYDFSFMQTVPRGDWNKVFQEKRREAVVKHLGIDPAKVSFTKHHLSHAAYAYYASPVDRRERVAVVTADGWGDGENASIYLAENGKLTKIHGTSMCNLARIYRYITLLLGMKPNEHEYKVMGLAPYAKEHLTKRPYEIFKKTLVVDGLDFKWNEKPSDLYFYFRDRLEGERFDGIAGGLQKWMDDMTVQWITNILNKLDVDTLVWSGGFSMNVKTNKAIAEIPRLKHFFVPPSGGDESAAIGAAYAVAKDGGDDPKHLSHAYLGHTLTREEVEAMQRARKVRESYTVIDKVDAKTVAQCLAQNLIIARCVGRMEFGARSLGNRSILCNPRDFDNIQRINEKIKFRDFWMPFTPSILDSRADDYLLNPKHLPAPYMTIAFDTTELGRAHLRAAIHPADFTARPQIVTKETNPAYYELIKAFEKLTGVGALLNTSLNLHGEPVVRGAEDAWHTFIDSGLDGLILDDTLILKPHVMLEKTV